MRDARWDNQSDGNDSGYEHSERNERSERSEHDSRYDRDNRSNRGYKDKKPNLNDMWKKAYRDWDDKRKNIFRSFEEKKQNRQKRNYSRNFKMRLRKEERERLEGNLDTVLSMETR